MGVTWLYLVFTCLDNTCSSFHGYLISLPPPSHVKSLPNGCFSPVCLACFLSFYRICKFVTFLPSLMYIVYFFSVCPTFTSFLFYSSVIFLDTTFVFHSEMLFVGYVCMYLNMYMFGRCGKMAAESEGARQLFRTRWSPPLSLSLLSSPLFFPSSPQPRSFHAPSFLPLESAPTPLFLSTQALWISLLSTTYPSFNSFPFELPVTSS